MGVTANETGATRSAMARSAMDRSSVYGLLAAVFRRELTAKLLHELRQPALVEALTAAGFEFDREFLEGPENEILETLAVAYTALFIGPGKHIPPYASVHMPGGTGDLWGETTVWAKQFIEAAGFDYAIEFHDLPDHLAVELELMRNLWAREAEAIENSDNAAAIAARDLRTTFVRNHLVRWLPLFCDKVAAGSQHLFYAEIAKLAKELVQWEHTYPADPQASPL
jgi:TorA maturation chaperone TorD